MSTTPDRPLSICMVSDDFLPGATGVGTHVQVVSRQLAARGHRISIITTRRRGESARESWHGAEVYRVPTVRIAGFDQAMPRAGLLRRILDETRPDVIHQHYLGGMMLRMMALARERGLPQLYTYHMTEDHLTQPWFMRPLRPLIARQIVRSVNRMDQVISVSAGLAATLPAKGITRPVHIISNPVDFPDPATVAPAQRDGDFVVMYAGRLEPEKNLPLLLKGFAVMAREHPGAVLWLAGRGSQGSQLQRLASELGIAERTRFLGFLHAPALASRYAACDVFVLPSLVETQGLVALEAMWFGRPVLVSEAVVSAPELVKQGQNGWIVSSSDPADLAARLRALAGDDDIRAAMGRAGHALAARSRPEPVIAAMLRVYVDLAGPRTVGEIYSHNSGASLEALTGR